MHKLTFPPRARTSHALPKLRGREMEKQRSVVDCLGSWQTDLCVGLPRSEKSETECPCGESTLYELSAPSSSESASTFSLPGTNLVVRDTFHFAHHTSSLVAMNDKVRDLAPTPHPPPLFR